jgi:hypothetical protein
MKKGLWIKVVTSILIILTLCTSLYFIEKKENKYERNHYYIKAEFNDKTKILNAMEEVRYVNKNDAILDSLYFHIYPNAYKEKSKLPFTEYEYDKMYPTGFSSGFIKIKKVEADGKKLYWKISGSDKTILKIKLNSLLKKGSNVQLKIYFEDKLPNSQGRYGYGENTNNFCNWYPIAAVYDKEGWHIDEYEKYGDPFYSDVADYDIDFSADKKQVLAFTGELTKVKENGSYKLWELSGSKVRDFAIITSPKFKIRTEKVGKTKINSYYITDKFEKDAIKFSKNAVETYNAKFGQYPYKNYSVVESDFIIGGMEYPNLVMIDHTAYISPTTEMLEYLIAHETGHQWWYGLVGNNEVDNAWLDESLTEYSTQLYYGEMYGIDKMKEIYKIFTKDQYEFYYPAIKNKNMRRSLNEFNSSEEYVGLIYNKGCILFNNLRKNMGDKIFFDTLKNYFKDYEYKNANEDSFFKECNKTSGENYKNIIIEWLEGKTRLNTDI